LIRFKCFIFLGVATCGLFVFANGVDSSLCWLGRESQTAELVLKLSTALSMYGASHGHILESFLAIKCTHKSCPWPSNL
jgi:hypothetical protein